MGRFDKLFAAVGFTFLVAIGANSTRAADAPASAATAKTAADVLPSSCVAYVELTQTKKLLDLAQNHPIRKKIEALPEVQKAYQGAEYQKLLEIIAAIERELGQKLPAALTTATDGGIYFAVDLKYQGGVLLVHSSDAKLLEKIQVIALNIGRDEAKKRGESDPYETIEYRGLKAYKTNKGVMAVVGPWLLVTNKAELGKEIADNYFDGGENVLARDKKFQSARLGSPKDACLWGWVDIATLRTLANLANLTGKKSDNPAAELLAGGLIPAFEHTPYATITLHASETRLQLAAATPFDPQWIGENRTYFFGPDAKGRARAPLPAKDTIMSLAFYRDLGAWWQHRDELFNDNIAGELAKADSGLTTLFGGRDFGSEVLAGFSPEVQLIIARQSYAADAHAPGLKLPAGALVLRLKEPEKLARTLKVQFQSLIGFINIAGGQYKVPKLELNSSKQGDVEIVSSEYLPEVDAQARPFADLHYNFTPTMTLSGPWCVISSTKSLGVELMNLAKAGGDLAKTKGDDNVRVALSAAPLREALADNKKHLISQNMLEKGHDREAAEKEIDGLLTAVSWIENASLRLVQDGKQAQVELSLTTAK